MCVSLDKAESSNPNLKAAHAGGSTRKPQHWHLQPKAAIPGANADSESCFAFFLKKRGVLLNYKRDQKCQAKKL